MIDKKDNEIELLKTKIQSQMCQNLDKHSSCPPNTSLQPNKTSQPNTTSQPNEKSQKKILFENFDSLSEEQLSKLRSIDQSKSADSTFVLNSVRYFYSDNLEHLQGKSVKGSRLTQAMSPVKLDRMELLYKERTWH